ncbi:hypothetical protein [Gilvimarinus sp. DA14]|uniref:hypothetical protein n=1 Tax=Gilvimarinus sp. DA14 TaxID=2956798 RepID=UPI0020B734AD|nr:hypothetical protein [Gilvimarinus sp. DA14]UTF59521.1 hypothetical protein NHM04_13720 [Gilvimarinus sp. DA14]
MKKLLPHTLCLLAAAGYTQAELKKPELIDCNAKKAARNAALDSTVGVSGNCDAEKLAKDAKDDVKDSVKDAKKEAGDKIDNAKENAADALPGEHHQHDEHKLKRD